MLAVDSQRIFVSVPHCLDEEIGEFLHDAKGHFALREEARESVEVREVEEQRPEQGLFDDRLELFHSLAGFFQGLLRVRVSSQL